MKKAYLVNYAVTTRIVIETEGLTEEDIDYELHERANERITDHEVIDDYICHCNMEYKEDEECPCGTLEGEK